MTRITDGMMFDLARRSVARARAEVARAGEAAASGKRVGKPSDDPLAASLARRETERQSRAEAALRSVTAGRMAIRIEDAALDQVGNLLTRAREIAIQAANATVGGSERAAAAREVEQIRLQVIALGNTEVAGRFPFGGYRDDAPPFDATGAYTGDGAVKDLEVARGVRIGTGVSATTAFGAGGGTDVIATLETLRVALDGDDVPGIGTSLGSLDAAQAQVIEARATLGGLESAFEVAGSAAERLRDRAMEARSGLVESEPFAAYSDLARAEQALQAAVEVAGQLGTPGLVGNRR